jgi:hypothetical protein
MTTDLILLLCYTVVLFLSKPERAIPCLLLVVWSMLYIGIASLKMTAIPTFPIYWGMAGICLIILASRGAIIVAWGMGAMFILQALLTADALISNQVTALYANYSFLALLINIVIIFLTFLHGRGLESAVNDISINRASSHDRKSH